MDARAPSPDEVVITAGNSHGLEQAVTMTARPGDAVLVEVARRLRGVLRDPDLIVRWGGEEFLVVVRALGPDAVDALAQRMLDAIAGPPVRHEGHVIGAAVSSSSSSSTPLFVSMVALITGRIVHTHR